VETKVLPNIASLAISCADEWHDDRLEHLLELVLRCAEQPVGLKSLNIIIHSLRRGGEGVGTRDKIPLIRFLHNSLKGEE